MRLNSRVCAVALTLGLAAAPALPLLGQPLTAMQQQDDQNGKYQNRQDDQNGQYQNRQDDQNGQYRQDEQNRQYQNREDDQNRQYQQNDNGVYQNGEDRGQNDNRPYRDNGTYQSDRGYRNNRADQSDQWGNNRYYRMGQRDAQKDRSDHEKRDHDRKFKNDQDRRAYEAGYNGAYGPPR